MKAHLEFSGWKKEVEITQDTLRSGYIVYPLVGNKPILFTRKNSKPNNEVLPEALFHYVGTNSHGEPCFKA